MAFRLGHQITCTINKNFFFRNSSVSARRYRSLSRGIHKIQPVDTESEAIRPKYVRARSQPLLLFAKEPWLPNSNQTRKYSADTSDGLIKQAINSRTGGRKSGANYTLQPRNLKPMATTQIHFPNNFLPMEEVIDARPYDVRLDELQRQASAKYEKAVKNLNLNSAGPSNYRYELDAARPKNLDTACVYNVVHRIKNKEEVKAVEAAELQPKNIKPYGDIHQTGWSSQVMERIKQKPLPLTRLDAFQTSEPQSSETINESRGIRTKKPSKPAVRAQHRQYSTVIESESSNASKMGENTNGSRVKNNYQHGIENFSNGQKFHIYKGLKRMNVKSNSHQSIELQQCNQLIDKMKKLNPGFIPINRNIKSGSTEEKHALEEALNFTNAVKPQLINFRRLSKEDVVSHYNKKDMFCFTEKKKRNMNEKATSEPVSDKDNRCSQQILHKPSKSVQAKAETKSMLQSLNIIQQFGENIEQLISGKREKFSTNRSSWGDKQKAALERAVQPLSLSTSGLEMKSNPKLFPILGLQMRKVVSENSPRKLSDVQFRGYSSGVKSNLLQNNAIKYFPKRSLHVGCSTIVREPYVNLNEIEPENYCDSKDQDFLEGIDFVDAPKRSQFNAGYRSFSTSTTRSVLGREGTVMVKLRRLPKVNIPDPQRTCEVPESMCAPRADDNLKIEEKRLPKLKAQQCPKVQEPSMVKGDPLPRLKRRRVPQYMRVCPKITPPCPPRADANLKIEPKKLPKLIPKPCGRCDDIQMTAPPLVRLKPRAVPPPKQCKQVEMDKCIIPRADEGLKVVRKQLPELVPTDCPRYCPPDLCEGRPLQRPKADPVPEQKWTNCELSVKPDICPPRADIACGYKIRKRKLPTLLLCERNNDLSFQEYAKRGKEQKREFSSQSKCDMCCYSNKKVQPDIEAIKREICPTEWEAFRGFLEAGKNGKIEIYDTLSETVDNSTGSELRIIKKPISGVLKRDDNLHERLLKGGYGVSFRTIGDRSYSTTSFQYARCVGKDFPEPPIPEASHFKNPQLKRLKKRVDFDKDFPSDIPWTERSSECKPKCAKGMEDPPPRMDNIMKYEVGSKQLPIIPRGSCKAKPRCPPKGLGGLIPPKKRFNYGDQPCIPKTPCPGYVTPRADAHLIVKKKQLPPPPLSQCLPIKRAEYRECKKLARLPKFRPVDPIRHPKPPCRPPPCADRADAGKDLAPRRPLPILKPSNCPRKKRVDYQECAPLKRLPPAPFLDREPCKPVLCPAGYKSPRADEVLKYDIGKKVLPPVLKNDGKRVHYPVPLQCPENSRRRRFSTFPSKLLYSQNFAQFETPCINLSNTAVLCTAPSDKKCKLKKEEKEEKKKCKKFAVPGCKPTSGNIGCKTILIRQPCTKQKSPYPAFSECKDDDPYLGITECGINTKHLQPKYPLLGEVIVQKPPPPIQARIDPKVEEECIIKKLNLKREIGTKRCDDMNKPYVHLRAKDLIPQAMNQLKVVHAEDECPGTKKTEDCPVIDKNQCVPADIDCELISDPGAPMVCAESLPEAKGKPGTVVCTGTLKDCAKQKVERDMGSTAPCKPTELKISPKKKVPCTNPNTCTPPASVQQNEPVQKKKCEIEKIAVSADKSGSGRSGKGGTGSPCGGSVRTVSSGSGGGIGGLVGHASKKGSKRKPCNKKDKGKKKNNQRKASDCTLSKSDIRNNSISKEKFDSALKKNEKTVECIKSKDKVASTVIQKNRISEKQNRLEKRITSSCTPQKQKAQKRSASKCAQPKQESKSEEKNASQKSAKCGKAKPVKVKTGKKGTCKPPKSKASDKGSVAQTKKREKCGNKLKEDTQKKPFAIKCPVIKPKCVKKKHHKCAKKCSTKPAPIVAVSCPKKSLWEKIVDFFRARPNCPAPDQWKKDKLKREAEKAAAAAGYALCDKNKPQPCCVAKKAAQQPATKKVCQTKSVCKKSEEKKAAQQPATKKVCQTKSDSKKSEEKKAQDSKPKPTKAASQATRKKCGQKVKADIIKTNDKCSKKAGTSSKKGLKVTCRPKAKPKSKLSRKKPKSKKSNNKCNTKGKGGTKKGGKAKCTFTEGNLPASKGTKSKCTFGDGALPKSKRGTSSCSFSNIPPRLKMSSCHLPSQDCRMPVAKDQSATNTRYLPSLILELPYPTMIECSKIFPKLPISEVIQQSRVFGKRKSKGEFTPKQTRSYSTYIKNCKIRGNKNKYNYKTKGKGSIKRGENFKCILSKGHQKLKGTKSTYTFSDGVLPKLRKETPGCIFYNMPPKQKMSCQLPSENGQIPIKKDPCAGNTKYPPSLLLEFPNSTMMECNKTFPKLSISEIIQPSKVFGKRKIKDEFTPKQTRPYATDSKKCKSKSNDKKSCKLKAYDKCPRKGRESCEVGPPYPPCTPIEPPYPSFSECQKRAAKVASSECQEQDKIFSIQKRTGKLDIVNMKNIKKRTYSTFTQQRSFCSCPQNNRSMDLQEGCSSSSLTNSKTIMLNKIKSFCASLFSIPTLYNIVETAQRGVKTIFKATDLVISNSHHEILANNSGSLPNLFGSSRPWIQTRLFSRPTSTLDITPQQIRHYSSPKDCKINKNEKPKCTKLPQQPCCPPKARDKCDDVVEHLPCTAIEAPYPSFSECYNKWGRIPVCECDEQDRIFNRLKTAGTYDLKNLKKYGAVTQKRHFSSYSKNGNNSCPVCFQDISEESQKEMDEKQLAKKVLMTVKHGMEAIAVSNSDLEAQEAYYQLYEELEKLCEQEFVKTMNVGDDLEVKPICSKDIFSDSCLNRNTTSLLADDNLQQMMTIDAIKSFCASLFSIPTMSATLYEESEKYKTEKLKKQLDEILHNMTQKF